MAYIETFTGVVECYAKGAAHALIGGRWWGTFVHMPFKIGDSVTFKSFSGGGIINGSVVVNPSPTSKLYPNGGVTNEDMEG